MTTPIERLLATLPDAQKSGSGWSARCPSHEDRRASLSISEGNDGRALVKCHAGCTVDAICDAVGLRVADLMNLGTSTMSTSTQSSETREKGQYCRPGNGKPAKTYPTAKDAIAALECRQGKRSAMWTYHDASGEPVGVVLRWDLPDGKKDIRPVARRGDHWAIGGMLEPRPLYGLPKLAGAKVVFVCEGEKAADAARFIGLTATTSAHGANSPDKTDWAPLAGKACVILPDNDKAGDKYADAVAAILAKLTPAPVVKVVELPGLPDRGDMVDWIDARGEAAEPEELRRRVEALADDAEAIQPEQPTPAVEPFRPFPEDALPEPLRSFVGNGAAAIGCDASYLALPLLSALAASIGNSRCLQLKRGWNAPAIIWTAIVGESGTLKTPAFKLVMKPLRQMQQRELKKHAELMEKHTVETALHKKENTAWERRKDNNEPPPEKPTPPPAVRFIVSDTTVEALAPLLLDNPRGLLMARDELAGWMGSFDRYAGKGGADAAHWLSMFNGESLTVDRKTGVPRTIYVPSAAVSVTGGIQPGILNKTLGIEHRESGLAARILMACPPRKPKRWTENDIDPAAEKQLSELFERLHQMQPAVDEEDNQQPIVLGLNSGAKKVWVAYYNEHAKEQNSLTGDLAAAWSKLEETAARLALIIHCVRRVAGGPDVVDAESMDAGIELAQWFKHEARRVYSMFSESDADADQRQLIEWIRQKGGSVTARDLMRSSRKWTTAGDADAALHLLVKAGYGQWVEQSTTRKGGRPTRVFQTVDSVDIDTTPLNTGKNGSCVNVDSVDAPETHIAEEWGEL